MSELRSTDSKHQSCEHRSKLASYYTDLTATRSPTNGGRTWKFEYMIFLNSALFDIRLITGIPHRCASFRKGFQDK